MPANPEADPGQASLVAFLSEGRAYGLPGAPVERIATHAAFVFLVGDRAYKMKRAVRYSFLDFSTLERRRAALEAELRLNRRTAPTLYHRVVPVTREKDGSLAINGRGKVVEWLLEMRRFDQEALLDRMAQRGTLDAAIIDKLAIEIAEFHVLAPPTPERGGHAGMRRVIEGNARDLETIDGPVFEMPAVADLNRNSRNELERRRDLLDERRIAGRVRHCHGDLHLGNVVLLDGRPVLFDCIEFDDDLASIDTFYDLAFLLMDLEHRRLRPLAQRLLTGYLDATWDDQGVALLPLFLSCRAAIRAKVLGFELALEKQAERREQTIAEARDYLARALDFLRPPPPRLIAIGGVSGTGKSTLAARLAPSLGAAPGAVVLRSDVIRKKLFGLAPTERLHPGAYRPEVSRRVYRILGERAAALIGGGHTAVVDAVFLNPTQRTEIEEVARQAGVPFVGLWLQAPPELLERRVRERYGDASDATAEVVRGQLKARPGPITWQRIDASGSSEAILTAARQVLHVQR